MSLSPGTEPGRGPAEQPGRRGFREEVVAGRARQLLTQPGVIFGFLGILRRQAWVSKTHEVSENALKEITSRDSVGGKKNSPRQNFMLWLCSRTLGWRFPCPRSLPARCSGF